MNTIINTPSDPVATLLLAHGSGAGIATPFMTALAEGISTFGITVIRFEFPYMTKARTLGKKQAPNSNAILEKTYRTQIQSVLDHQPLFIGGKSMGGRIASQIADVHPVNGCICLGYPFHPPGNPSKLRTAHLQQIRTPVCILQGTRDPFGTKTEILEYPLSPNIQLHFLEYGNHSFETRKKDPVRTEALLRQASKITAAFIFETIQKA